MSKQPSQIQISLAAIAKMVEFDLEHPGKETAGLLIGHEENSVVYVDDVRFGDQTGNAVHVEVSEKELTNAAIEISERRDNKVIVGWIHTHPGLSAFLSPTDIKTQSSYQAFMPNAIAIVLDGVKYSETRNIDDLDLKVFRVVNGNAKEFQYKITDSIEFGLNTYLHGEYNITQGEISQEDIKHYAPVPAKSKLESIRMNMETNRDTLHPDDYEALNAWLSLAESMETGDVVEVPIDVDRLLKTLDNSLNQLNDELNQLNYQLKLRRDQKSLILILLGLSIELGILYFWLFA